MVWKNEFAAMSDHRYTGPDYDCNLVDKEMYLTQMFIKECSELGPKDTKNNNNFKYYKARNDGFISENTYYKTMDKCLTTVVGSMIGEVNDYCRYTKWS